MSRKTVKICLGLQLKTSGIVLKTFKTIFDEEILSQKLQLLSHHFIAKDLKTEITEWFKRTWKASGAVSQQLKPTSAQSCWSPTPFPLSPAICFQPLLYEAPATAEGGWPGSASRIRQKLTAFFCLVSCEPVHRHQKVPTGPQQLKYSLASARH